MLRALKKLWLRFRKARLARALKDYRACPGSRETIRISRHLMNLGRGQDALAVIAKARRLFPGDRGVRRTYDSVRARQASLLLRQARAALKRERSSQNFVRVADLLRARRQFGRSLACIAEARKLFPDNWGVELCAGKTYFYRANASRAESDLQLAIRHFRAALELHPHHYSTSVFLAIGLTRVGAHKEALQIVKGILEALPEDPKARELELHLERVLAAAPPLEAGRRAFEEKTASTSAVTTISKLQAQLPSAVGLFLFSKEGALEENCVRPNDLFELRDCTKVLHDMVVGLGSDSERMGMGPLSACHASGGSWQLLIRSDEEHDFVGFFDQSQPAEIVEREAALLLAGRASRLAAQTTHG